ncbi:hypothetical protein JTB14_013586 [Gonioctena quinquepunctata]|nr:hypothetical protein JTB14_013586 [Gonioctena quinquepunctata]
MEPDLAYVYSSCSSIAGSSREGHEVHGFRNYSSKRRCWNCGSDSHLSIACKEPQKRYCYSCGHPYATKRTCPKCNGQRHGNYQEGGTSVNDLLRSRETNFANFRSVKCILDFVLSHAQGDERPYVTVSIFGKELSGLLDLGASHTILGNKGWKFLKDIGLSTLDRTSVSSVTVANGDKWVDFWVRMGIVPDLLSKEWKFTQVNGTFADINAVEASHSRELLTSEQVEILDKLVNDCFVRMGNSLGCNEVVEHKIELLDNGEPIKQRFYPVSPVLMEHIDEELQDMLKKDVIEPSSSPWSSPIVMTDASAYGIGAVLTQNHPDVGKRVVSYLSRSLTKQERKCSTTERECLAVICSKEKLRPHIEGTHFTVVTDHWSLCWLNNL